ncbi:TatD family hydrolase [Micromonospora narathiwatensis]|uniref:TatD DNase family protein n=1 Tax=Micromonospora narathiwatensis TaxID=299146 RepID=A0A1A9AE85_9ACTN|nr:TatD family hydrolase [Micromonospora narathiwatensis]SBT54449.1 TatD DNase family protein [Micromonospora narathiwatensis]
MLAAMTEQTETRRQRAARRAGEFPPAPEALPVPVLDSHTHLDITVSEYGVPPGSEPQPRADGGASGGPVDDPVAVAVAVAAAVGVDRLVQVGVDVESSRWGADVAGRHSAVLATVALHPNEAPRLSDLDEALREIESLAARDRVRGIGETGMDFFRTGDEGRAAQEESFRAHIAIAKRYGKALVIHDRDAHADVLRILDDEGAPDTVVMHCFSGDADFARDCVRRGYLLSFAGTVTFGSAGTLREAAVVTPIDQLLVETDAPYLTPMPHRGRPNASYLIPLTVRALAETTGTDLATLCAAISATGDRAFGPW